MFAPLGPDDPREIGGYRLLARIGEGGMGTVYLSRTRGGQAVALKVIRRDFGEDTEFRRRFAQEVRAARLVQGYHLVPVVDHDTSGPRPWLATVFVPGLSLRAALEDHGPLPLPSVMRLMGCTAQALVAIHTAGVVHRDLKPGNIVLGRTGPYVIDFGIARAADTTHLTRSGGLIGTPQFMSPEHAQGEDAGPASDVFSLGLIAALAATGSHPYGTGGAMTLGARIANTAFRPPRLDGFLPQLREVLEQCLAADPAVRITPAALASLCEPWTGRAPDGLDSWLPGPLAAEIARREQALPGPPALPDPPPPLPRSGAGDPAPPPGRAVPPDPAPPVRAGTGERTVPPAGAVPPGGVPAPPAAVPAAHAPSAPAPSAPAPSAPGPSAPGPSAPGPSGPVPRAPGGSRRRAVLRVALAAGAAVLLVAGTWLVATRTADPGRTPADGTPGDVRTPGGRPASPTPGPDRSSPDTTAPETTAPSPEQQRHTLVFENRPLSLRAPSGWDAVSVDLDEPRVGGPSEGSGTHSELTLDSNLSRWEFLTPMGRGAGPTAEQCLRGARTDVLPSEIEEEDLSRTLPVGTLLCTVTSDKNIAMVKVTKVVHTSDGMPDYFTEVTLWRS
ncbi:serine/threonine-protein kinase [Streptomyces sp. NPDC059783]|uniref:serine/threonine-protein kinase n=1 Tax=Streptomyces sp. NPDC059783 TaxID=3346944 RepID=UPI00365F2747